MRKFIFGIIAVIVVCIIVVSLPKREKGVEGPMTEVEEDTLDVAEDGGFWMETLSDKDIYYHVGEAGVTREFLPDSVVGLVDDLVDAANGYAILRNAYCDAELWFRFGMVVNDEIGQLNTKVIRDSIIRIEAEWYVNSLVNVLPRDTTLWNQEDSVSWNQVWKAYKVYADRLSERFALSHFGEVTEKDVQRYLDVKPFIANYDSVFNLRKVQSEDNEHFLKKMVQQAPDFDRKCLYTIEYAHQRRYDDHHPAIPMLEELMKAKQFSRYLHDVWMTWRVLRQIGESPSREGIIHNLEYNQMRFRCLNTIIKRIIDNPHDILAINDFLFLATYDNITRYSAYLFGNSAPLEQMMLFPEILEDNDKK